mmetsp:Transcript_20744/g.24724  ORF Transcript_20744/g.24724 Transcript_20744/m.24724 type:complete len:224 (-) Transcript_20744:219-890(-)
MTFLQTISRSTTLPFYQKALQGTNTSTITNGVLRCSTTTLQDISKRWYRGDSGEMTSRTELVKDEIDIRETALLAVAVPRAQKIYDEHTSMPRLDVIPKSSLPPDMKDSLSSTADLELEVRKKRLVYRSKQRGWLEVDLLLGTWASKFVHTLEMKELDEYEDFVNMETIDIYNIITLRVDVPDEVKTEDGSGVVEQIQEWARSSPLGKDPVEYSNVKKEHNLI